VTETDRKPATELSVVPLTADRWQDFRQLFGARGACGGCWCMYPRTGHREFEAGKGEPNRKAMRALVTGGRVPGLLGYAGGEPIAWCSIEPRSSLPTLARSRILTPVDELPVWSIVCLFVARSRRRQGLSIQMIAGSVAYAAAQGAVCVEAYPVEPKQAGAAVPPAFAWTGLAAAYRRAGFSEVARRSATRPIMRRMLA
jgi:GNAT superfamily N-acetyltransferase